MVTIPTQADQAGVPNCRDDRPPGGSGRASRQKGRRRAIWWGLVVLASIAFAYVFFPRGGSLYSFQPADVARREAALWRDYYDRNNGALFWGLYSLIRTNLGLSPWDSFRMATAATRAAVCFQNSRSREQSVREVLPHLEHYYRIVQRRAQPRLDVARLAQLELEWWQVRREFSPPQRVAQVLSEMYAELYQAADPRLEEAARRRVEAMRYRDTRRYTNMTEGDWEKVETTLRESYTTLLAAVGPRRAR